MNLSCLLCYQASPTPVCQWCEDDLFFFNSTLHGDNLLRFGPVGGHVKHSHYNSLSVLGLHTWPMSTLVHQFKFNHTVAAGKVLSNWFVHKKRRCNLPMPHVLLPVPISVWRLAKRHYNQTQVIATILSQALCIPVAVNWSVRRGWQAQHSLSKHARQMHAKTAFQLTQKSIDNEYARAESKQENLRVAIIDDVITTGGTVNALSKMLKARYPAIDIEVWAMTFTPPPKSVLLKHQ